MGAQSEAYLEVKKVVHHLYPCHPVAERHFRPRYQYFKDLRQILYLMVANIPEAYLQVVDGQASQATLEAEMGHNTREQPLVEQPFLVTQGPLVVIVGQLPFLDYTVEFLRPCFTVELDPR